MWCESFQGRATSYLPFLNWTVSWNLSYTEQSDSGTPNDSSSQKALSHMIAGCQCPAQFAPTETLVGHLVPLATCLKFQHKSLVTWLPTKQTIHHNARIKVAAIYTVERTDSKPIRGEYKIWNLAPGNDLQASIEHDVMCDSKVLETWSEIAYIITPRYESYSLELLKSVCHLWTTICGFSFTEGCNILFKKSHQRGTRKTLIKRGTDKDTN